MSLTRSLWITRFFVFAVVVWAPSILTAQIVRSSPSGFQIKIERKVPLDTVSAYQKFVSGFNQWYDANHSYSGKAENLSLDLKKACMLEKLPDGGFVRHMEIVVHQPGKTLRMTGGLGPLQSMGVSGALTLTFEAVSNDVVSKETPEQQPLEPLAPPPSHSVDGLTNLGSKKFIPTDPKGIQPPAFQTMVTMQYIVTGADFLQLDKIAVPVNKVLGVQMDRFQRYSKKK